MHRLIWAAMLSAAMAGPVWAGQTPHATGAAKDAAVTAPTKSGARIVYVCDNSELTRRSFAREFGRADFVRADEVLHDQEAWSAPKCMTRTEAARLRSQLASRR